MISACNKNHVLTLSEVKSSDFVYIEFNPKHAIVDNRVEPCGVGIDHYKDFICLLLWDSGTYSYKQFFNPKDYNVMWRCWRLKPTHDEMRNARWRE